MTAPASYEYFDILLVERRNEGLLQVGVTGSVETACKLVRTRAALCTLTIRFLAVSRGGPPEVPAAQAPPDANCVLLESYVGATVPIPTLSVGKLYTVMGEYVYARVRPRPTDSAFMLGALPAPIDNLGNVLLHGIPAQQFLTNMLNTTKPMVLQTMIAR